MDKTEYMKQWRIQHIDSVRESRRKWNEKNKDKIFAQRMVEHRVESGIIKRLPCEVCGDEKSQAHHPDYSKPLDVIWLCQTHHKQLHIRLLEDEKIAV